MNPLSWFNVTDLTSGIYLNPRPPVVDALPVYLDFFLFLALLGWTLVLLTWWWHPRRADAATWHWVPWAAAIGLLHVLVEFLNLQLAVFGNARAYSLPVDLSQCALWLLAAGLWWWTAPQFAGRPAGKILRWSALGPLLVAVALRRTHPEGVAWFMTIAALLAGLPWLLARGATFWSRLALAAFILCPALSTTGPLAHYSFTERRSSVPSLLEPWAVGWQALAALIALIGLWRHALALHSAEERHELLGSFRSYAPRALAVVVLGVFTAAILGEVEYDRAIERSLEQVREVRAQVDTANLARLLDEGFRVERLDAGFLRPWLKATLVRSSRLASPEARVLHATLDSLVLAASSNIQEVRLVTLRDGHLIALCGKIKTPGYPGLPPVMRQLPPAFLGRPATAADRQAWQDRAEVYDRSVPLGSSGFTASRVPLTAPDGRMLGWLEFIWPYQAQMLSAQKVRAVPFIATVLGVALIALFFVQSQHARAREAALRRAAVETEGNRMKTAFLASVSHELRTPLQSILGYSELLRPEICSAAGQARLGALRGQGTLMIRLVNDLLDLSALEAGSFQLSTRVTGLTEIMRQTVESLRPQAEEKGLGLGLELAGDLPEWVEVDDGRLRQVLINLLGNAIKFTDEGTVTVSLRGEALADGRWRLALRVRDTGPGIPAAQQPRLFAPFHRLAQTADKEGSGLGLAITAALCHAMGGQVTVESDGRTGSIFIATLLVRPAAAPVPGPVRTAPTGVHPRVLIVDDNRLVRDLFLASLSERGAVCRAVATGTAALVAGTEESPEVIVLDLALPDGDGTDFVPRLREIAPGARIIGVSAHAGAADRTRALAAGMDAFLLKPVLLDDLWSAVTGHAPASSSPVAHFDTPEGLRAQLLREFRCELPAKQAELAAAIAAGDRPKVQALAHYLRNSALVVRADALFVACTGLEAAAADQAAELPSWWQRTQAALTEFSA